MGGLTHDLKDLSGFECSSLVSRMNNDKVVQGESFSLSSVGRVHAVKQENAKSG